MFDSAQFNGFVRNELDDLLFSDIWNLYIFNESDLHSAAYHYCRRYFERRGSEDIFVRCEPQIRGKRPDLVVYHDKVPIYAIEIKMFAEPEIVDAKRFEADLEKLSDLMKSIPTLKFGFLLLVFDADEDFGMSDARLHRRGYEEIAVISMNMRRQEGSGRRRVNYDEWRADFDALRSGHAQW
jgi:hypothetical protein